MLRLLLTTALSSFVISATAQGPSASFVQDISSSCIPLTVSFTSTSTNASTYYWDFGNGNTSTLESPTNVYVNAGIYDVKLVATNSGGVSDTLIMVGAATAVDQPVAGYYAVDTSSCLVGNSIAFINTTSLSSYWLWDFGDGYTSTNENVVHSYDFPGIYSVTLIAGNNDSCENLITKTGYITIYDDWDAIVTVDDSSACTVSQGFLFSTPTTGITSYLWDFGDGLTSNLPNPTHAYLNPGAYTITLWTTNANGCTDMQVIDSMITIDGGSPGIITSTANSGCKPLTTNFTDSSSSSLSWLWDFGDGTTDTARYPQHTYSDSGVYDVSLIVTNTAGCTTTTTSNGYINVQDAPKAKFQLLTTSGCSPFVAKLKNKSTNASSWYWDFGDGNTSTLMDPAPVYTEPGDYTVTLIAFSNNACSDTVTKTNLIKILNPTANFSVDNEQGCTPLQVQFSDSSINAIEWLWSFDDGSYSTQQNPTHQYQQAGSFDVSLVVKNSYGCVDTATLDNPIVSTLQATPYTPPPPYVGCAPFSIGFEDHSPGAIGWIWDFGDSSDVDTNRVASHVYTETGTYTVSLQITSGFGCDQFIPNHSTFIIEPGEADFSYQLDICNPKVVSFTDSSSNAVAWNWDFGDSATSTLEDPIHTYDAYGRYLVKLEITTAAGCTYNIAQMVLVEPREPIGTPFLVPSDSIFPMTVNFYANSNTAVSWFWMFGDNTTSSLENPVHTYNAAPNGYISLIMTDGICTDSMWVLFPSEPTIGIAFGFELEPEPVDSAFYSPPVMGCIPFNIHFQSTFSNSTWDFGDGTTSTSPNPIHTYSQSGIYDVSEIGVNDSGIVDTLILTNYIILGGVEVNFTSARIPSCDSISITFTDNSVNAFQWSWDFGDGNYSSSQNATNKYPPVNTTYSVALTVYDSLGCANSKMKGIYVGYNEIQFSLPTSVCLGDTVLYQSTATDVSSWAWDFGDGVYSTDSVPTHAYQSGGTFGVSLTTMDSNGCEMNFVIGDSIVVHNPIANFTTMSNVVGCDTLNIVLDNTSTDAASYSWNFGDGTTSTIMSPVKQYTSPGQYSITLTAYASDCRSELTFNNIVEVNSAEVDFDFTQNTLCLPITVSVVDSSTAAVDWLWDFGDSTTYETSQSPQHTFTTVPPNDITLTIVDLNGCTGSISKPNISILQADFTVAEAIGCAPHTNAFSDQSSNAVSWLWEFGDGFNSTEISPIHIYQDTGVFDVQLVVESSDGCFDTLYLEKAVSVYKPFAAFSSVTPPACAPSLVSLQDQSIDAVTYEWNFGDNTGSSKNNPDHIYVFPGNYTVELIVTDSFGCSDTAIQQSFVIVLGPIADASSSVMEGCEGMEVTFTDQSTNSTSWSWGFGDGSVSTLANPTNAFNEPGTYAVSLITEDSLGCTSLYVFTDSIQVHPYPKASFTGGDSLACSPYLYDFVNTSIGADTYLWSFDDGATSTMELPQHEFEAGNYAINLIVSSSFGCTDTAEVDLIVHQSPTVDFTASPQDGCYPLTVDLLSAVQDTIAPSFTWVAGSLTSNDINPTLTLPDIGYADVSLIVINSNGCKSDLSKPNLLYIFDTLAPEAPNVNLVTVVSNTAIRIVWDEVAVEDFAAYRIIRRESGGGSYIKVVQLAARTTTQFIDESVNTLTTSYCYVIQTVDQCGNVSNTKELISHCTIELSSTTYSDKVELNWTPYQGCKIASYEIFRSKQGTTSQVFIGSVKAGQLTFTDTSIVCPDLFSYRILATSICGKQLGSLSDTTIAGPIDNKFIGQVVNVIRSTVQENSYILTEWAPPVIAPEYVAQYKIFRAEESGTYQFKATVSPYSTSYIDEDVNINEATYQYKIEVQNICELLNDAGSPGTSILLQSEVIEDLPVLYWTPYDEWDAGVHHYEIERKNADGEWEVIKKVGPGEKRVIIKK